MELVVHLGAHRCATTTLQAMLRQNLPALAAAGVAVWAPPRTRDGLLAGLMYRGGAGLPDARRLARTAAVIAVERQRVAATGAAQLILTDENLLGSMRTNLRLGTLYPELGFRLAAIAAALGPCRRIGLAVRGQADWWSSAIAYAVARGHRLPDAADLARIVAAPRRWQHVVAEIARACPGVEVVVWPFERLAGQPEAQLGLLTGGAVLPSRLAGMRDWRNATPRLPELRHRLVQQGRAAAAAALPPGDGRWRPFDQTAEARLRAAWRADLAWFRGGADGFARFVEARGAPPDAHLAGQRPGGRPGAPPNDGGHHGTRLVV